MGWREIVTGICNVSGVGMMYSFSCVLSLEIWRTSFVLGAKDQVLNNPLGFPVPSPPCKILFCPAS